MTFEVGDYRAIEQLGSGASAQVWLGIRISTGSRVAIKVFAAERLDAARREAALAAAVDHPHVVRVLDVVGDLDRAALVTEYAAGGDLADLLERRGRLTASETLTVLLPMAAALATAHEREIVHGDLSAGNVLFDRAGRPLLADLGAGRAAAESGRPVFATPVDAAPELARGGPPTPATDMFSLGSLALACLTGRHAWPADDLRDVLIQAAAGQWPDPGDDAAPPALVALVRSLLEHDPERRPGAATLVLDLKAAGRPEPLDLRVAEDRPPPDPGIPTLDPPPMTNGSTASRHGRAEPQGRTEVQGRAGPPRVPRPGLHPSGRVEAVGRDEEGGGRGSGRGRDGSDPGRVARSRAVTRRRADAVPAGPSSAPDSARRPARLHLPAGALRVTLLVTSCLLVIGIAGAAGLWWAGWGRSEPVAVGGAGASTPSLLSASPGPAGSSSSASVPASTSGPAVPSRSGVVPSRSGVAPPTTPATDQDWTATVRGLDDARAKALVNRDIRLLDSVYTPGAPARSADAGTIGTMLADGVRVSGAVHLTRQVKMLGRSPIRVVVQDSLPSYSILDGAGRVVGRTPARVGGSRVLVLVATPAGYRISQVRTA